ncbi:hypothetical protein C8F04DRAFT_60979 [Mycena alexandri]|uniref:Uncharacterized protein n=1 Tax=Mycena alexandri TaxID=1745969 RepID=A0AAD6SJE9_9AGAR|nr:hypothetical protein C8F04DRAFT_60979 [Mycena alexandri]
MGRGLRFIGRIEPTMTPKSMLHSNLRILRKGRRRTCPRARRGRTFEPLQSIISELFRQVSTSCSFGANDRFPARTRAVSAFSSSSSCLSACSVVLWFGAGSKPLSSPCVRDVCVVGIVGPVFQEEVQWRRRRDGCRKEAGMWRCCRINADFGDIASFFLPPTGTCSQPAAGVHRSSNRRQIL